MVPGVDTKLSARLSAGECSNLMCGVFDMFDNDRCRNVLWGVVS
jgi:hypothetical protein